MYDKSAVTSCSCYGDPFQQALTPTNPPRLPPVAEPCKSPRRTIGGWAPPICPSRVWAMFAATRPLHVGAGQLRTRRGIVE